MREPEYFDLQAIVETAQIVADTVGIQIGNAAALLELEKKITAFEKRTGKKVRGKMIWRSNTAFRVIPPYFSITLRCGKRLKK